VDCTHSIFGFSISINKNPPLTGNFVYMRATDSQSLYHIQYSLFNTLLQMLRYSQLLARPGGAGFPAPLLSA
jgi:hypothetical protein